MSERAVPDESGWWPPFSGRCAKCGSVHEAAMQRLDDVLVYYTAGNERLRTAIKVRDELAAGVAKRTDAEIERLRRRQEADDCSDCGYPMDNDDPDEGDDQWYCPRCKGDIEIERLQAEAKRTSENMNNIRDRIIRRVTDETFEEAANDLEGFMAPDEWSDEKKDGAYRFSYIAAEKFRAKAKGGAG